MRKTNTALIALIGFGIFIIALILVGILMASNYPKAMGPRARQITNTGNLIIDVTGGITNAGAPAVNDETSLPVVFPGGLSQPSSLVDFPANAAVIEYGLNVTGSVNPPVSPTGYAIIRARPTQGNLGLQLPDSPVGTRYAVVNQRLSTRNVVVFFQNRATMARRLVTINPGFFVTFTADSPTTFVADIPSPLQF